MKAAYDVGTPPLDVASSKSSEPRLVRRHGRLLIVLRGFGLGSVSCPGRTHSRLRPVTAPMRSRRSEASARTAWSEPLGCHITRVCSTRFTCFSVYVTFRVTFV